MENPETLARGYLEEPDPDSTRKISVQRSVRELAFFAVQPVNP
jgi:hypothetical protein